MTDLWTATAQRAAAEARWLRPLILTLFVIGLISVLRHLVILRDACSGAVLAGEKAFTLACALHELGLQLIAAGPALALLWALYETQAYLKRLEDGDVFAPSTMKLFARIGEALIMAAAWAVVIAPTLSQWVAGHGGFDWQLDAKSITLGGLGIALVTIARVLGEVLASAEAAKADSDAVV